MFELFYNFGICSFLMITTKLNQFLEALHKKENKDISSLEKEVAEEIENSVA